MRGIEVHRWEYVLHGLHRGGERGGSEYVRAAELDDLIYNDPVGYAYLVLNGDLEAYLRNVTEYKPLES